MRDRREEPECVVVTVGTGMGASRGGRGWRRRGWDEAMLDIICHLICYCHKVIVIQLCCMQYIVMAKSAGLRTSYYMVQRGRYSYK